MRTTLLTLALASMSVVHSQTSITQLTDAAHSQGYISWNTVTNHSRFPSTYRIAFYDQSDPRTELLSFSTGNNWIKVDPSLFQIPNLAYRMEAISESQVIATSTPVVNESQIEDPYEIVDYCTKKCNGTSYAYEIRACAKKVFTGGLDNYGHPNFVMENIRLFPAPTSAYMNTTTGVYVPFLQAISTSAWSALPSGHPYLANTNHMYDKTQIPNPHPQTILDAYNSPVATGWFIPKRMDQFDVFNGPGTSIDASPGTEICSAPFDGSGLSWNGYYNDYHDYISFPSTNAFVNEQVTELACHEAYGSNEEEGGDEGGDEGFDLDEWYDEIEMDFAKERGDINGAGSGGTVTWGSVLNTLADLSSAAGPDGDYVTNIVFTNIHNPSNTANLYRHESNTSFVVDGNPAQLTTGLYTATAFTNNGIIFPYYMGLTFAAGDNEQLSKSVTLTVAPNPATDGLLKYSLNSEISTSANYFITDIGGTELGTGSFSLEANTTLNFSFDVHKNHPSTHYVILSILLSDGSVLQELVEMAE